MTSRTLALALCASLATVAAAQTEAPTPSPRPTPTPVTIHSAEASGLRVFFLNIPWGPQTFAAMERPGDSFYNKRTWPFARLESKVPLSLDGTHVPPGNYALVFHPNTPDDAGIALEVKKIAVPEFLQDGNAMTRTPEGETLLQAPIRFDTTTSTAPELTVGLQPGKGKVTLRVQYGDRLLVKDFDLQR
jgi:hypothetical protein